MAEGPSGTETLVALAAAGDKAAWGTLLASFQERLVQIVAFRMDPRLRKPIDAADVVQEAFIAATERRAAFFQQTAQPLFLWLRWIVGNTLLERHRHHFGAKLRDIRREVSSDGGYDLTWSTIDGGGAMYSTGGAYELTAGFRVATLLICSSFAPADFNTDCSVDTQDFAIFAACITGPAVPYNPASPPSGCTLAPVAGHIAADLNSDGGVDQRDFARFQRCYSGPGMAADPGCVS